jgi:hypothetical protein
MLDISSIKLAMSVLTNMKIVQASILAPPLLMQSKHLGELLARLRIALRYLDAIAPGTSLEILYSEKDPALAVLAARERTSRVREMSAIERDELNF